MSPSMKQAPEVAVVAVPLAAQGHLNQMLHLCTLISAHGLPVHYVGSTVHNRQVKSRINALDVDGIIFHDIPIPPFLSPPPNPDAINKYPSHLSPAVMATLHLRGPVTELLKKLAHDFRRVVVINDPLMATVVQAVAEIQNAESYEITCISAFSGISFMCGFTGKPFPLPHPKELPPFEDWISDDANKGHVDVNRYRQIKSGNIYNTSRLIEGPYVQFLEKQIGKPVWAIGPMRPTSSNGSTRHECLEWLDKQAERSVMYVSFGTTVSLSDEQIKELAHGLERSKVKFLWVLRDADKGDVFDGEVRRAELPEGFEERVGENGIVVRDWAPQPQILAHRSVGGFMSHCGWNSCMESITNGVAIAAWPMHSDQPSNAALVADILKTGMIVREWKERKEVVKASRIESVVRSLMASEEGEEIRKRAEELGADVRKATESGGVSRVEMESFIAHITRDGDVVTPEA